MTEHARGRWEHARAVAIDEETPSANTFRLRLAHPSATWLASTMATLRLAHRQGGTDLVRLLVSVRTR